MHAAAPTLMEAASLQRLSSETVSAIRYHYAPEGLRPLFLRSGRTVGK